MLHRFCIELKVVSVNQDAVGSTIASTYIALVSLTCSWWRSFHIEECQFAIAHVSVGQRMVLSHTCRWRRLLLGQFLFRAFKILP